MRLTNAYELAESIANNIINGNLSDAINQVKELNSLQAIHIFGLMQSESLLNQDDLAKLARLCANKMND